MPPAGSLVYHHLEVHRHEGSEGAETASFVAPPLLLLSVLPSLAATPPPPSVCLWFRMPAPMTHLEVLHLEHHVQRAGQLDALRVGQAQRLATP